MAEGFAHYIGKGIIEPFSAGSRPSGKINPKAIKVMREVGVDISTYKSKGFNDLPAKAFDYVISLGCKDVCPFFPATKHIEWDIDDPKGKTAEFFRRTRDQIKEKIKNLIEEFSVEENTWKGDN